MAQVKSGTAAMLAPPSLLRLSGHARLFSGFTFNRYRPSLAPLSPSMIAVGAVVAGRPCGLALGSLEGNGEAELLSIAVAPEQRRRGIGVTLIETWRDEARRRGASRLTARYNETAPGRRAFEALAARAGWNPPTDDGLVVVGRAGAMAEIVSTWRAMSERLSRPDLYEFAPMDLSETDRAAVAAFLEMPAAAGMFGPMALGGTLASEFSTLIRRQGRLVGWVLAAPAGAGDTREAGKGIRYLEAFLDPAYWHSGVTIGAYYHCYARQAELLGWESLATYYTNSTLPRMVALTRRRFAPIADRIETIWAVRHGAQIDKTIPHLSQQERKHL